MIKNIDELVACYPEIMKSIIAGLIKLDIDNGDTDLSLVSGMEFLFDDKGYAVFCVETDKRYYSNPFKYLLKEDVGKVHADLRDFKPEKTFSEEDGNLIVVDLDDNTKMYIGIRTKEEVDAFLSRYYQDTDEIVAPKHFFMLNSEAVRDAYAWGDPTPIYEMYNRVLEEYDYSFEFDGRDDWVRPLFLCNSEFLYNSVYEKGTLYGTQESYKDVSELPEFQEPLKRWNEHLKELTYEKSEQRLVVFLYNGEPCKLTINSGWDFLFHDLDLYRIYIRSFTDDLAAVGALNIKKY